MTTKEPVAVQRYKRKTFRAHDTTYDVLDPAEDGDYVEYKDHHREVDALTHDIAEALKTIREYEREIAAAERRGAEKAREAAVKACDDVQAEFGKELWGISRSSAINASIACADTIDTLPIEQILKGEA